jgi:hypothetical protein
MMDDMLQDSYSAGFKFVDSLMMGISFGTGALFSFYLLKHLLINKLD